jgi:hypothetical protein
MSADSSAFGECISVLQIGDDPAPLFVLNGG